MNDSAMQCPICKGTTTKPFSRDNGPAVYEYHCLQCGNFKLTDDARDSLPGLLKDDALNIIRLSHVVRWMPQDQRPPLLSYDLVHRLVLRPLPDLPEQVDKLVLWLGQKTKPGTDVSIKWPFYGIVAGTASPGELEFLVRNLVAQQLIEGRLNGQKEEFLALVQLSFAGWRFYEELLRGTRLSKRAFMAMKFGDSTLDVIVNDHFRLAVQQTGFELFRLDDQPEAGLIDNHMRVEIRRARFLIADLTHDNPGAYWEAGFAEGLGRPVIYTCERSKFDERKTHFDTNHCRTVLWESSEPAKAAEMLKATIRTTLPAEAILDDGESST